MSNHIHFIWTSADKNLSGLIRDFKSHTSKSLTTSIQEEPESRRDLLLHLFRFHANKTNANEIFRVWTGDNHPEEIHSSPFFTTNYEGRKGLIDIDILHW